MSLQARAVFDFAAVEGKVCGEGARVGSGMGWAQMGEKTKIRMGEPQLAGQEGPSSAPVASAGPHVDKGKRKVAPVSGLVRQVCGCVSPIHSVVKAGPSGSHVFLPVLGHPRPLIRVSQVRLEEAQAEVVLWRLETEELWRERARGYVLAQEREEELGQVRHEQDKVVHACDSLLHEWDEFREWCEHQGDEVDQLRVQLAQAAGLGEAAGPVVITAAEIDELAQGLQEAHELEGQWREWLLCEVVGACDDALTWARKH
ncbi:hypothetical protein C0992_003627 [Termitomyces sp. T32_za158]|nr:hypothetical protein C0992_003627 [Termitomyces sp. T32_za158]